MASRFYSFVNNLYMSPIQLGIQTAHAVSNMSIAYAPPDDRFDRYFDWALNNPVIMICKGHNVAGLNELRSILEPLATSLNLPFTVFNEDEASLGGIITAVAILVPEELAGLQHEKVTNGSGERVSVFLNEDGTPAHLSADQFELLKIVKLAHLA